jgi:hypothetical protein
VSVRRASREHAELLVNLDLQATQARMQMQIIRNCGPALGPKDQLAADVVYAVDSPFATRNPNRSHAWI